jgi:histidinol phosphatase-like PHP family hydrolase
MKIDFHVHSSDRSDCGRVTDEEQVQAAINAGLDGFFFTDHHRFISVDKLDDLNRRFAPFRVFRGIEISCDGEDFLVLGIADRKLESYDWRYADLHAFVHEHNGFIVLAHPFRFQKDLAVDCERLRPDAIEICSANTPANERSRIQEIARAWNIPTLCNSDAHSVEAIGKYFNILDDTPENEITLIDLLRARRFHCHELCV